ncbi:hypothetical protein [Brevundimonas lutea]|uniref:hypothetical protein n=1 Tax=Brevundimonas lutea TaxID=2293980 RepID=UPI000F03C697|nr:hypothetical protein [Brevundimonas lutea]
MRVLIGLACALALTATATPTLAQLPAMRDRPLSAAERGRLTELEGQLQRISAQRNTSAAAVRSIARKLGARLTTSSTDEILKLVDEKAGELSAAKSRIAELEGELDSLDSMRLARAVQPLLQAAQTAIEEGELEIAEAKLAEAASQFGTARETLQGRVADLSKREAEILGQQAQVRRAGFDYLGAADLYGKAAELETGDANTRLYFYIHQAENLSFHGVHAVDLTALDRALAVVRDQAIPLTTTADMARYRGAREFYGTIMGNRLMLDPSRQRHQELIELRREILASVDRATEPEEWARQRALVANAEGQLGQEMADRSAVVRAIQGYAEAEPLMTDPQARLRMMHAWANALKHLGSTYGEHDQTLGAIDLFKRAVAEAPQEDTFVRAYLLDGLAAAETGAAMHAGDAEMMDQAAEHSRESLALVTREESAMSRAGFSLTLARALGYSARLKGEAGAPHLVEARAALAEAGEVFNRDQAPVDWIWVELEQASLDMTEARIGGDPAAAEAAEARYRAIQAGGARELMPATWVDAKVGEAYALQFQAEQAQGERRHELLTRAQAAWAEAIAVAGELGTTTDTYAADAAVTARMLAES